MLKKPVIVTIFFVVLCLPGLGCVKGGAIVGLGDGQYFDGPYRNGSEMFYYNDGAFYYYQSAEYRFHHHVPEAQQRYYEERYRKHHEKYHRDNPNSRNQHPGHPGHPPRVVEWKD